MVENFGFEKVRALTDLGDNITSTYPHCNMFCADGSLILRSQEGDNLKLWRVADDGSFKELVLDISQERIADSIIYHDVCFETGEILVTYKRKAILANSTKPFSNRVIAKSEDDETFVPLSFFSADHKSCIFRANKDDTIRIIKCDRETGVKEELFRKSNWNLGHPQAGLHNTGWIGYCHEVDKTSPVGHHPDRVCGWHGELAPEGKVIFQQSVNERGDFLYLGHERWCWHDDSVLVVAYGESPCGPRGLYEAFVDERPTRLVSEGNRDWHCNVSRDGRWAVVDTTGKSDLPGKGWEGAQMFSDIVLVDMVSGERRILARCLHGKGHPYHPHPTFSPDGKYIVYNNTLLEADGEKNCVMRVDL